MRALIVISVFLIMASSASAYEKAFARTENGVIELKTLPAGRLLESTSSGDYFNQDNSLFMPLFRYISDHDISMTTPVEAQINPGKMYFWVTPDQVEKAKDNTDRVRVIDIPERRVAAIGAKGRYSESNYEKAKAKLMEWVGKQEGLTILNEPYAVYWNGPFTPWFMKRFEVHVQVRED